MGQAKPSHSFVAAFIALAITTSPVRRRGSSSRLRSLGRSPSQRSFAPLSRGSPPRARFEKPLRGPPPPSLRDQRESEVRRSRLKCARDLLDAVCPRPRLAGGRDTKRARHEGGNQRALRLPRWGAGRFAPSRSTSRACSCDSVQEARGVPVTAFQSEREEETRDRAERGSAVRGSDQASVAAKGIPLADPAQRCRTKRRC